MGASSLSYGPTRRSRVRLQAWGSCSLPSGGATLSRATESSRSICSSTGSMMGAEAPAGGITPTVCSAPRMSPGFASSFISLRGPPDALDTGKAVSVSSINNPCDGSHRRCALRSEIKEEAEGRGTFAAQSTPSA